MTQALENPNVTLVLGGARSGKTRHALSLCETLHQQQGCNPVYIATAQAFDDEMRARIEKHQDERGPAWQTVEEPMRLGATLRDLDAGGHCIMVDCLTLWLTNQMLAEESSEATLGAAGTELVATLCEMSSPTVLVSNEVGLGIVPENALARRFRDHAGRLNQDVAKIAGRVVMIAAGLPLDLKPARPLQD